MENRPSGSQEQRASACAPREFSQRLFGVLGAVFLLAALPYESHAGELSLLVNGKAIHINPPADSKLNEENWGLGLEYEFDRTSDDWLPFVTAAGFKDSNDNMSYYAGGGWMRRFSFGTSRDPVRADLGLIAFVMTRKGYHNGDPFLGLLPALSVGTPRVALNMTYIPKIDPKMVALVFFQLKIGLGEVR
jgi:hypothetical protein